MFHTDQYIHTGLINNKPSKWVSPPDFLFFYLNVLGQLVSLSLYIFQSRLPHTNVDDAINLLGVHSSSSYSTTSSSSLMDHLWVRFCPNFMSRLPPLSNIKQIVRVNVNFEQEIHTYQYQIMIDKISQRYDYGLFYYYSKEANVVIIE